MATNRRRLLAAAAATVPLAGCAGVWNSVEEDVSGEGDGGDGESTEANNPAALDEADEVVAVGPQPDVEFDPDSLEVQRGTVVGFRWDSGGHSITVRNQPEDGGWQGVPNAQDAGHVHVHTFDTQGRYDYYCGAHQSEGEESEAEDDPDKQGEAQILVGMDAEDVEGGGNETGGNETGGDETGGNETGDGAEEDQPQSPNEGDADDGNETSDS